MAELIFYDSGHVYTVDGIQMSSVSEVIRFISREMYDDIAQYTLDNAAARGKSVHKACEVLYKYKSVECAADVEPYVRAFSQFLKDHDCDFTDIEKPLADTDLLIAGTPDFCGRLDGKDVIVDIKAQSSIKKTLVKAQLNAYRHLRIKNGYTRPEALYCLQLMNTGRYRLYPTQIDDSEFAACYALHTALKKKHERGEIK